MPLCFSIKKSSPKYRNLLIPKREQDIICPMRVIAIKALKEFWEQSIYADSEQPLKSWFKEAKQADWSTPADIKSQYGDASILKNSRVVFNIHGNKYRVVVKINYPYRVVYIRFIGTHKQYDHIDSETI